MSSTPRYAYSDVRKPDGFYVQFAKVILEDDSGDAPDKHDAGFWPSTDSEAAGYIGENPTRSYAQQMRDAEARMEAWRNGEWTYIGVRACARCLIVRNGVGTSINLDSAGLWGIESDAGDYLDQVYAEQIDELKELIAALQSPVYE